MPIPLPNLDDRTFADLAEEMRALIPRYAPAWTDHNASDPGITLIELFAWLTEALIYRLNRIPEASEARFLELLGVTFAPARPATVTVTVTAGGLEEALTIPRGTPLAASPGEGSETIPFETLYDLELTPEAPNRSVIARQTAFVQGEQLGTSDGKAHQALQLARPFLALEPDQPSPIMPQVEVDGVAWAFRSSLLDSAAADAHFTVEPRLNAIRFGDGRLGRIPPEGAEIVASYPRTLGKRGNVPAGTAFKIDTGSNLVAPSVRQAMDSGASFSIRCESAASGGADPTGLEEARDEAIDALKTRWRAVTAQDFEGLVVGQAGWNVARARCFPEWDLTAPDPYTDRPGHVSVIVVPSPESKALATLSHGVSINTMAFSPDGGRLATASDDHTARLWDVERGTEVAVLHHEAPVNALAFNPDGERLATASDDHTARLWDASRGETLIVLPHEAPVNALVLSPDGRWVATASDDHTARLWDAKRGTEMVVLSHETPVSAVVFSPDMRWVATASDDHAAHLWDAWQGKEIAVLRHGAAVNAVVFSPDGNRLVTASDDHTARLWDARHGEEMAILHHEAAVNAVAFSPDGRWVATASDDYTARLWDAEHGAEMAVLHHRAAVNGLAFSRDGARLATASDDHTALLWDAPRGEELTVLPHGTPVNTVVLSADGGLLTTASDDNTAWVWREPIKNAWDVLNRRRLITCRHHVVGPKTTDARVQAEVVCIPRVSREDVEAQIMANLQEFFHPLRGGPDRNGEGWPFGRDVYASEVYQVIEETEGVDHVESLTLYARGESGDWQEAGDRVVVDPTHLVHFDVQYKRVIARASR